MRSFVKASHRLSFRFAGFVLLTEREKTMFMDSDISILSHECVISSEKRLSSRPADLIKDMKYFIRSRFCLLSRVSTGFDLNGRTSLNIGLVPYPIFSISSSQTEIR